MGAEKSNSSAAQEFRLENEYKKNMGISAQDISKLREWLHTQPHLPGDHITDLDLILTYRCCGRSSAVTKQVLDLHFTLRTLFTSFFKDRQVDAVVEKTLKNVLILPLPTRSTEGCAVLYTHFLDYDARNFNYLDFFKALLMVLDLWQYEEGSWPGFLIAMDLQGMTLGHLSKFEVQSVQRMLYYLQEAMLVNLKGLHLLNAPPFMDKIMILLKPFLKKALMDVLFIHQTGSNTLDQYYPVDALPKDAGGSYRTLNECRDDVLNKIKANQEFFILENKKRVVEAKRPGRPKTISDIFGGVEGSFKKLDID